ncbi:MAG: LysR substrate-binding domain-containing protein [Jaaginema sp. PMC 1079.18]|nr:LysR substrate-binding domain-containing protein [Jaaginema sp. PMC 1080.18]MEC4851208.1 LysR substrate-binding domain-containing protein [Jaaginema sp. PMC 1079.18]MEC4865687.1 LysR substrate-binding domain-containing protein [Jaaginema sp. PMC 1078.18]
METDIELRQLRYFAVVAEELNFTKAAERLKIAQPPLSRQIQSLEKALQVQLLERTNRRVNLTPAGAIFLEECHQILNQVNRSIHRVQRASRGEIGQLTIGFEGAFHNETILRIIRQFRSQFPDVDLILQEMPSGQQMEALSQQEIDVGFIDPILSCEDITSTQLVSEPLVVVLATSHPLAAQDTLDLRQLESEYWITGQSDKGCGLLIRLLEACRQAGFTPNIQQETNDIKMTLGFVASGLGVTLLPLSAVTSGYNGITYRKTPSPLPQVELAVAWESHNSSSVLNSFLNVVRDMFELG